MNATPTVVCNPWDCKEIIDLKKIIIVLLLERQGEGEREKHQFVVPLIDAFLG